MATVNGSRGSGELATVFWLVVSWLLSMAPEDMVSKLLYTGKW